MQELRHCEIVPSLSRVFSDKSLVSNLRMFMDGHYHLLLEILFGNNNLMPNFSDTLNNLAL